ncbi:MAG TPA: DapH/DapD/GlmU-related protein [Acidobacteriaceae bacterium]|nr:DapH/DapD/GlmU-related protein [Acidobacteriaceae bacterium]
MGTELRRTLRFSNHPAARAARTVYAFPSTFSLPNIQPLFRLFRFFYESLRSIIYFIRRVFIAEPIFKSYCHSYGKRLHTDIFVPWVQGKGRLVVGDDVLIDGRCSLKFAFRYKDNPTLRIGNNTGLGHGCSFTVANSITIGNHCRIASGVIMFDTPGHPLNPEDRKAGESASEQDVRPIEIGNNVWIGRNATIFPGVTIGDNSVVASGASVMASVPADTVVGGNPARAMKSLAKVQNV